jgi:hypothetical protein
VLYLRRIILIAAIAVVGLLAPAPQRAEAGELDSKIGSLATKLAEYLKDQSHTEVALNDIVGPPDPATNSGPGIQTRLIGELAKKGIKINNKAALIIEGKYLSLEDDENKKEELIVRLILFVSNKKGERLREYSDDLSFKGGGNDEIAKLLNMQLDLSEKTKATPYDRNQEMKEQLKKPRVKIDDYKVKTTEKSLYAVEVLVQAHGKGEFKAAAPTNKDGNVFIELKRGDVYKLRLHNNSKIEAAVTVTIDGVDAFQFFEPEKSRPTSFLVQPTATRDVKGWPRGTESHNEFLVGSYSDSAAAKVLKSTSKLGTITVCFHPCWTGKVPPPEYDGSRSIEPNGTGLGKEVKEKTNVVPRTIGPLVTSIAIRYNK